VLGTDYCGRSPAWLPVHRNRAANPAIEEHQEVVLEIGFPQEKTREKDDEGKQKVKKVSIRGVFFIFLQF
jgi:hypothetical protein